MRVDVIEFELTCPEHGKHRIIVPERSVWPRHCAHCFAVAERSELRRFRTEGPLGSSLGSEAWVG
jgi:hypothetical protein